MKNLALQNQSSEPAWSKREDLEVFPILRENVSADVCIVGGGITGISCAYRLMQEGKKVVVVDNGPIAGGETYCSTAHLASEIDDRIYKIEQLHGRDGARLAVESHADAINEIESIIKKERINCDFERVEGFLFSASDPTILQKEYDAAQRAGLDVERVDKAPLSFETGPALRFPRQAQFNPVRYINALTKILVREGVKLFSYTSVTQVKGNSDHVKIFTKTGNVIVAGATIIAANAPFNDKLVLHTKQAAYRTYVIGSLIEPGTIPHALFWDTADPYHYIRVHTFEDKELLIIGGEDHRTGQEQNPEKAFEKLEAWARARFHIQSINFRWSGQILEPIDGVAFIGPNPLDTPNIYIATGDSGMGITHGVIASILLTDLIMKRENEWLKLYNPSRKTLKALKPFLEQTANVIWQYRDWFADGQVRSAREIKRTEGAVLRKKFSKIAVYRDKNNNLQRRSAVCPHLGGIVRWNSAEKSWDCPCHGSRFDTNGNIENGPSSKSLSALKANPKPLLFSKKLLNKNG